ncbi:MAG: acyltransferase [Bacteroidetes bacterium]|jgi:peptidoglycan/LPS O-acetylase OafA/YrhL|nr:acyltransferase [Bacteroidota bacterium]
MVQLPPRPANNFDLLRILFAWFVIISHSYVLNGLGATDPLFEATNQTFLFSFIGVKGFFIISGYLIFKSMMVSKSIPEYLIKRTLRIFPALAVVLLVTLVAVFFIYPAGITPFFYNKEVYAYFIGNLILFKPHFFITGVFSNLMSPAINGSLWTIEYEFFFYLFILGFFFVRSNKKLLTILLGLSVAAFLVVRLFFYNWTVQTHFFIPLESMFDLGPYFLMGALLSCYDLDQLPAKNVIAVFLLSALLVGTYMHVGHTVVYFTLPYLVIYLGKKTSGLAAWVHQKLGDPSYGIYLYAFPLQQFIIYLYKPSTLTLFVISTIGAFAFGYLSWILIEKKALALKAYFKSA